jgi:tetratricopeptide (TPR) repeat protein
MALDERLRVAGALLGKGEALVGVDRYDEAVACYGQVVERFGESDEPEIGKPVRIALARKGSVLLRLDRVDEAHAAFDESRARAARAPNPELASARAEALIAKALGQAGRHQ